MKATIDFDPNLYRQIKIEAARRGTTVRDLLSAGARMVLAAPRVAAVAPETTPPMPYFGMLHRYAANANGRHDMDAMRESVARARRRDAIL